MFSDWNELERICNECKKCKLSSTRNNVVLGTGPFDSDIMFIGEAPGKDEDLKGVPFVGKAGQLMDKALMGIGINRKNIYITNIVKCRPPQNIDPQEIEMKSCMEYLESQINLVKPKVIVLLGRIALHAILPSESSITKVRGKWIQQNDIYYMPIWHPSAVLRDENKKIEFWNDLQKVKDFAIENKYRI